MLSIKQKGLLMEDESRNTATLWNCGGASVEGGGRETEKRERTNMWFWEKL